MAYGKEMILDLYKCDSKKFNRESITRWLIELCELLDMQREDLHFWDYEDCPEEKAKAPIHLVGTSAVQFITTSDIVIHTIELVGECYINIFTCKEFSELDAIKMTREWFSSKEYEYHIITRGSRSKAK